MPGSSAGSSGRSAMPEASAPTRAGSPSPVAEDSAGAPAGGSSPNSTKRVVLSSVQGRFLALASAKRRIWLGVGFPLSCDLNR
eukprot:13798-Amphidinium_carterae.1